MLSDIESTNKAIFDTGNLVQNFLASASYEGLTDSIEGFLKENDKITAKNVEEMAESCEQLQILLEQTEATAQGLASAFTLFENGTAAIDDLTSALLVALSVGENFDTLIGNVSSWMEDFKEGTDLKEGTEHIVEILEKGLENELGK